MTEPMVQIPLSRVEDLISLATDFASICAQYGDFDGARLYKSHAKELAEACITQAAAITQDQYADTTANLVRPQND